MGAGQSNYKVPETMRRLVVEEYNADISKVKLKTETVPVPKPGPGEVLVKICAAPVNPSDYGKWRAPPAGGAESEPMGNEGSGIVVASGGGYYADSLLGKKVGVTNFAKGSGSYQEFAVLSAMKACFLLPDDCPVEDAASFFVNPYTAAGFVDTCRRKEGATGFVHTAAASQLGQMLVKLCKQEGLTLINVVRRDDQAKILTDLGAEHIVVTDKPDWKQTLTSKMKELNINIIFDAISGSNTGDMVDCLPPRGVCYVYGGLSGQLCSGIHPIDLIYKKKRVEGWFLRSWIQDDGNIQMILRLRWAGNLVLPALKNGWSSSQFVDTSLDEMIAKFHEMWNGGGFTNKKLRIRMDADLVENQQTVQPAENK